MKTTLLIAFTVISLTGFTQTTDLKLASDVWPPFTNVKKEKSFALDLVSEALKRISIKPEIEILSFDKVISGIDMGEFDGSSALWLSPERKNKYLFSNPYLQNQLILVGKKGSDVTAKSLIELKGKRIGLVENYAYGDEFNSSKYLIIVKGKNDQQNLERLLSDKIDYMLVDALLIQYMLKFQLNDVTEFLEIAEEPLLVKPLHFAIRKDIPDGDNIIDRFNNEIKSMIADGTYHKILELNWIKADIDGDGQFELILNGSNAGKEEPQNTYEVFVAQPGNNQSGNNKYYIDGNVYNNWEEVPVQYKKYKLKGEAYNPNLEPQDYGLRLKF